MTERQRTKLQDPENPNWKALGDALWEMVYDPYCKWGSGISYHPRRNVRLSEDDWEEIKRLIIEREIPVTVDGTCFGFSVGISLWQEAEFAWATLVEPAQALVTIPAVCLPTYEDGPSFDLGWEEFSPLTHSDENLKRLEANKLELPSGKDHYAY